MVVSNDGFNAPFDVVTVLPLTKQKGKKRRVQDFEVLLGADFAGIDLDSIVMPHHIRTISKTRLLRRLGILTDKTIRREVEDKTLDHLGISLDEED